MRIRHRKTPISARRFAERYARLSRKDWKDFNLEVLLWVLEVRFYWNHHRPFGRTLLATGNKPIVYVTRNDTWMGAREVSPGVLCGHNHYGRLLTEVRDRAKAILAGEFTQPDGFLE